MFKVKYGTEWLDGEYETEDEAEEAIQWEIEEFWDHHPTLRCEYSIEEV